MSADQMRNFFLIFQLLIFFILGNLSPFFLLLSAGMENKGPNFLNGFKKTIKVETSGGKGSRAGHTVSTMYLGTYLL